MQKITFVNGQAPALNANNLNSLQDNIENAIPTKLSDFATILYYDADGTKNDITLNQTVADFDYLIIYYGVGTNQKSAMIYSPNNKTCDLALNTYYKQDSSNFYQYFYNKQISISGTSITNVQNWELRFLNRAVNNQTQDNKIYIFRVEGYN